ncbi:Glutamate-rich WD repeat-containing protein 1 [Geodia barretti]|uniref:Glutamate-rich WD repeat-containing protein 1 n=1 Tax=Geodia barretti TaxID=519541 RepID=A0AA35WTU9_GEOBA|nr:Glutamate-rich WD repeat-containing protein 1 [Geodia barretti]
MLRSIPHARMRNPAQFLPHPFHARRDEMASPSGDSCGTLSDSEEMGYEEDIEGKLESSCDSRQDECQPEEMDHESSAYHMLHTAQSGAPCLSFDIIRDSLGDGRTSFPLTCYVMGGTQAQPGRQNFIVLMKLYNLVRTLVEDGEDDDEDDGEEGPQMESVMIQHTGAVNRLRVAEGVQRNLVATWSEQGTVSVWDTSRHVILLDSPSVGGAEASAACLRGHQEDPLYAFSGHQAKGYGLAWSPTFPGRLATGDCTKNIYIWEPKEEGVWQVGPNPLVGHTNSVEDIQWSPNEPSVLATCSVDQTVRIWDCRAKAEKACMLTTNAHNTDVNVISWNHSEPLLVSGADDGSLKIWDLRQFGKGEASAEFQYHSGPVTSVEWAWHDSTVFASSGADHQVVQWDLAVERDGGNDEVEGVPPQLLFIHQGQRELKELHWHPQLPGVLITTALSGFNIFRTISV